MINYKYLGINKPKTKYRRILFIGTTELCPGFMTELYNGKSLKQEIEDVNILPCLIQWEKRTGEQYYAEITKVI